MNIKEAFEEYQRYSKANKASDTVIYQIYQVEALLRNFEMLNISDLEELTKDSILCIIENEKNRGCCNRTINMRLTHLRLVLKYYDLYTFEIKNLRVNKKVKDAYTEFEIKEIVKYLELLPSTNYNLNKKVFVYLLIDTGARRSEILNINIEDIDFKENEILLKHTKTKKERYVFFDEVTKKYLLKLCRIKPRREKLLWNYNKNVSFNHDHIDHIMESMRKTLQFQVNCHKFRHTKGTVYGICGLNAFYIQELLGHADIKTSQQYVHIGKKHLKDAFYSIKKRGS